MIILSVDSSAGPASAALLDEDKLLGCYYQNCGLTHSATLMPIIDALLKNCRVTPDMLGLLAVSVGPGSFTGIRIGVSTIKGLSLGLDVPCVGVSTLEAMAEQLTDREGLAVCVMDARRNQVYNAVFKLSRGASRITPDRTIEIDALMDELTGIDDTVYIVGDGAALVSQAFDGRNIKYTLPFGLIANQTAAGVAYAAKRLYGEGKSVTPDELNPVYLRLSQAERELLERGTKQP